MVLLLLLPSSWACRGTSAVLSSEALLALRPVTKASVHVSIHVTIHVPVHASHAHSHHRVHHWVHSSRTTHHHWVHAHHHRVHHATTRHSGHACHHVHLHCEVLQVVCHGHGGRRVLGAFVGGCVGLIRLDRSGFFGPGLFHLARAGWLVGVFKLFLGRALLAVGRTVGGAICGARAGVGRLW